MRSLTLEDVREKEEEGRGPLLPDDVAMTERVKELLAEELSTVYGIPQKQKSGTIRTVLDTITQEGRTYGSAQHQVSHPAVAFQFQLCLD